MSDETGAPGHPEGASGSDPAATPPYGPGAPPPPPPDWSPAGEVPPTATAVVMPPPPTPPTAVGTMEEPEQHRDRGGLIWFGVILIGFGLVVLAGQVLPGISWWMLWPLIIIVAGVVQAVTRGKEGWSVNRLFDGLVTIAFGLVLLGNTTGVIGWDVWWRFLWLWPVLLIAAGIGIIARAVGQRWLGILGSILVILALGYAAAMSYVGYDRPFMSLSPDSRGHLLSYSAPVQGVTEATLNLDAGAGEVRISGGDELVKVEASSPWGTPTASVDRTGDTAEVDVAMSQGSSNFTFPTTSGARMDLELSTDTSWDVIINSGAVNLDADFEKVPVSSLELKTGVSDSQVTLGAPDMADTSDDARPVNVKSGVSSVTLRFPEDAAVRVRFQTGLSGNDVPEDYRKNGDVWESAAFDESGPYWDVTVESGVGSSKIETY